MIGKLQHDCACLVGALRLDDKRNLSIHCFSLKFFLEFFEPQALHLDVSNLENLFADRQARFFRLRPRPDLNDDQLFDAGSYQAELCFERKPSVSERLRFDDIGRKLYNFVFVRLGGIRAQWKRDEVGSEYTENEESGIHAQSA